MTLGLEVPCSIQLSYRAKGVITIILERMVTISEKNENSDAIAGADWPYMSLSLACLDRSDDVTYQQVSIVDETDHGQLTLGEPVASHGCARRQTNEWNARACVRLSVLDGLV